MTTASSDRSENGDGALKKDGRRWQARLVLIGFDGRGQIARLLDFFGLVTEILGMLDWTP